MDCEVARVAPVDELHAPAGDIEVAKLLVELSEKLGKPLDRRYYALAEAQPEPVPPRAGQALYRPERPRALAPIVEPTLTEEGIAHLEQIANPADQDR